MITETARALFARTITADGDVMTADGEGPAEGYLLPLPDLTVTIPERELSPERIADYIRANLDILGQAGYYVGASVTPGTAVLTVQANILRRRDAAWYAEVTGQPAAYDVTRGRNVTL